MDLVMEDVIKNIIHIDKNANKLRERMEVEIKERQLKIEHEIEKLRIELITGTREKAVNEKNLQMERAAIEAEEIINQGRRKALELEKKFEEKKQELVDQIFKEII